MRYYVRPNRLPRGRAELRLVVKAGSVLEDNDQRGLAHFVEHMAFNGSRNFPRQQIATFMQAIGMRFGAHVNAHTSFDETVYELQIPTTDARVIDQALLMMEDWTNGVTFDPAEVDKERGVILEEWRLGLGADARMQNTIMPILLQGSRYAERSPIGTPDSIRNAPYARLKQFYTDWYRPDLMAVIIVGDFDPKAIEAGIKAHFGPIPAAVSPRPRTAYTVPAHAGTLYAVATDREATNTTVGLIGKMPARDQRTVGMYRQQMVERLFSGMLSDRLVEISRTPDAPFQAARSSRGLFVRTMEATTMQALVADGGAERGLTALVAEAERVAKFGFTATELERQKVSSQRYLQQALAEKDTSESAPLAEEFIRNFMNDEPIPGISYEQAMAQRLMPGITLEEVNKLAATWLPDGNRVVVVNAPERAGLTAPTAATLAAAIAKTGGSTLSAYVDVVNKAPLLDPLPAPGKITGTTTIDALGITEWRLSNGARVVLKPTNFKADEVLFRAISPGGTSLAPDRDFVAALTADEVVAEGGLGRLNRTDLDKALSTVNAAVRADITDTEEGLRGGAARGDIETMFQLINLSFTAPRADPTAFGVMTANLKRMLANQETEPEAAFSMAVTSALTGDHPRARPLTPALGRSDEPRQVARLLQGPLRRRQRLHLRVRRQLRPRRDAAAGRALSRLPAVAEPEGSGQGRRHPPAGHGGQARSAQGRGAEERSEHRLLGRVREHRSQPAAAQHDGVDVERQSARDVARGPGRHLRRQRRADVWLPSHSGISRRDQLRVRPGARGRTGQRHLEGDCRLQGERPVERPDQRRPRRGAARSRDEPGAERLLAQPHHAVLRPRRGRGRGVRSTAVLRSPDAGGGPRCRGSLP